MNALNLEAFHSARNVYLRRKRRGCLIPNRWKEPLMKSLLIDGKRSVGNREPSLLRSHDFGEGAVRVEFEDGSLALFQSAFALYEPDLLEVAVFTEHCGYFYLNAPGIRVFVLRNSGRDKTLLVDGLELATEMAFKASS